MYFSKNLVVCSSAGPKISTSLADFRPTLDCYVHHVFKLKYEDAENIQEGRVNTVVFDLNQMSFFLGHPVH